MHSTNCWNVLDDSFPEMTGDPVFSGYYTEEKDSSHFGCLPNGGHYTDFYFQCRVQYTLQVIDDGARFNVSLTFNGERDLSKPGTHVVTNAAALTVRFPSSALTGNVGKNVNINLIFTFSSTVYFNYRQKA